MPRIVVVKPFAYAHRGYDIRQYAPGPEPIDMDDEECAAVALAEGWAEEPGKAHTAAPENKDAAPRRRTKGSTA
jgi:hypothetical protein